MISLGSRPPLPSCAMRSAAITADWRRSGGYFEIQRSISASDCLDNILMFDAKTQRRKENIRTSKTEMTHGHRVVRIYSCVLDFHSGCPLRLSAFASKTHSLPVNLAEHDVLRADDRHHVGDHVAADHLVQRREVGESRGADLEPV